MGDRDDAARIGQRGEGGREGDAAAGRPLRRQRGGCHRAERANGAAGKGAAGGSGG